MCSLSRTRSNPLGMFAGSLKSAPLSADRHRVADKYRCPHCNAAIPQGAAWCSLCLANLAPQPVDSRYGSPLVAGVPDPELVTAHARSGSAPNSSTATVSGRAIGTFLNKGGRSRPVGRHSAGAAQAADLVPAVEQEVTVAAELTRRTGVEEVRSPVIPAETQLWAEQVLTELRKAEPGLLDPQTAPGGKWGMAAIGTTGVVVVLLIVYTLLGFVVGR